MDESMNLLMWGFNTYSLKCLLRDENVYFVAPDSWIEEIEPKIDTDRKKDKKNCKSWQ